MLMIGDTNTWGGYRGYVYWSVLDCILVTVSQVSFWWGVRVRVRSAFLSWWELVPPVFAFWVPFFGTDEVVALKSFSFDWLYLVKGRHVLFSDRCWLLEAHWGMNVISFFLTEEVLLRSQYGSWSCNSDPTNESLSLYLIMFHCIYSY